MSKFILWICLIAFSFILPASFGQPFTFQSSTQANTQQKGLPKVNIPPRHTASSPADFKKGVASANLKEQNDLTQQSNQKMKSILGNRANKPSGGQTSPSTQKLTKQPSQPATQEPTSAPNFEEYATEPNKPSLETPPKTITPLPTPTPQQAPPEVYTGFPTGGNKPTSGTPAQNQNNQGSSGGWNIQY